jgi:hypothetical protein
MWKNLVPVLYEVQWPMRVKTVLVQKISLEYEEKFCDSDFIES